MDPMGIIYIYVYHVYIYIYLIAHDQMEVLLLLDVVATRNPSVSPWDRKWKGFTLVGSLCMVAASALHPL